MSSRFVDQNRLHSWRVPIDVQLLHFLKLGSRSRWVDLEVDHVLRSRDLCTLTPYIVLSFISAFGGPPKSPGATSTPPSQPPLQEVNSSSSPLAGPAQDSPTPRRTRTERSASRPMSMVQAFQPPLKEIAQDTIPELQPIFSFLNSHSNKLYQEGYFLKLNDLDSRM